MAATAVLVVAVVGAGIVATSGAAEPTPTTHDPAPSTATVERGTVSDAVTLFGTVAFRARADGSPFIAINQWHGTFTWLPAIGSTVACGGALYRVDDRPVLLLCGPVPAYRSLGAGDTGADVRQLNANLHSLGLDAGSPVDPNATAFSAATRKALVALQRRAGLAQTGLLKLGEAVFLPGPVRIAKVAVIVGASAQPAAEVVETTSDDPEVLVSLDPSQLAAVRVGEHAQITLPDNSSMTGTVARLGSVTRSAAGQDPNAVAAMIPAWITLDRPDAARPFDSAAVRVEVTTDGVQNALSVPVVALLGTSGGGFAVEVVRPDGRRDLVAVTLGLFDASGDRVEVHGALAEGDQVVVPSS